MPLKRSDLVDVGAAFDLAGAEPQVFAVGGATVALGTAATVVIAGAVDDPAAGGVWNDQELRLQGPAPVLAAARLTGVVPCGSAELDTDLPVHLFARVDGLCCYLGLVRPSGSAWTDGELNSCELAIDPPLSREILDIVRPTVAPPGLPGLGWLDHVDSEPGWALELFVTGWHPEAVEPQAVGEIPRSIPPALADFYRLAARYPGILGGQNRIRSVGAVRPDSSAGFLVFADENQGGWDWSIPWEVDATNSDPAVWVGELGGAAVLEQEPLSRYLLQFSLYEAASTAPFTAALRNFPKHLLPVLGPCLQGVPLRTFMAPVAPTDFLVGPGIVAGVSPSYFNEDEVDVWIGARHRSALHPLLELGLQWQRFDG
ncbi:hypothetical protein ACFYS8_19045 [Kitasatospora sp. NPDC004615]|uniref:hypothetical protein n=1 Tax=Kitasatospora sp. NPDC004615 TaxID=3364017 RepID=UPI003687FC52